jgi:hypothetical protein
MPQSKARSRRKRVVWATNRVQDLATSVYLPLCTDRREIRLLTLSPGQFQDEIHSSLSNFSLNECPPYEALSYVWGAGGFTRKIFVSGLPKHVTQNLEIALRHLRHVSQTRVLWVDAICINQRDIPERNTQVIHMGDVYRSAFRVIAWLGEKDEDSNLAYDALEALPTDEQVHWDFSKSPTFKKTFLEAKYTTAIERLFRRAWWQRMWTVQESILGPTLYFVCGSREISADIICDISLGFDKHVRSCCQRVLRREHIDTKLSNSMVVLYDLWMSRTSKDSQNFIWLLSKFRFRLCSDPRDKVYGVLGLCSAEERKKILPDYSTPVSLVYEQVALNIIKINQSLDVFSQVCRRSFDGVELATVSLPSWVPDWTLEMTARNQNVLTIRQERNDDYRASSGVFASVKYIKQGRIALKGILLGVVAVLGTPNPSGNVNKSIVNNWRDMARVEALPDRLYNKKTSTTYYDAFWQTLCCSIPPSRTSLHDSSQVIRTCNNTSYRSWYNSWCTWVSEFDGDADRLDLVSSEYSGSEIYAFGASVEVSTSMRRLFISSDEEWLGFAPINAIAGDVIALLEGGSVPYILRPRSKPQAGDYELIGDAYVHGVMDGERWNPDLLQEIILV